METDTLGNTRKLLLSIYHHRLTFYSQGSISCGYDPTPTSSCEKEICTPIPFRFVSKKETLRHESFTQSVHTEENFLSTKNTIPDGEGLLYTPCTWRQLQIHVQEPSAPTTLSQIQSSWRTKNKKRIDKLRWARIIRWLVYQDHVTG